MLPDLDSNQDKLNQNQLYCHYTIGQSMHSVVEWGAKIGVGENCSKFFNRSVRILNPLLQALCQNSSFLPRLLPVSCSCHSIMTRRKK